MTIPKPHPFKKIDVEATTQAMNKVAEAAVEVGASLAKLKTSYVRPEHLTYRPFAENEQFKKLGSKTINPKAKRQ